MRMAGRTVYASDGVVALVEYRPEEDDRAEYECWMDAETQRGYNCIRRESFEEYVEREGRARFNARICRVSDGALVGAIFLSKSDPPDLAILVYAPYRGCGLGTRAFRLGADYCLGELRLERIYAGCYEGNLRSMRMLAACGFAPHPEGNSAEKHYLTGEPITQYDFVREACSNNG